MQFLDREELVLDPSRDDRFQLRLLRQRGQAQHFKQLLPISPAARLPSLYILDTGQATIRHLGGFHPEIVREEHVTRPGPRAGFFFSSEGRSPHQPEKEDGLQEAPMVAERLPELSCPSARSNRPRGNEVVHHKISGLL